MLRERRSLDRRIAAALSRPKQRMRPDLRDVLRIGAYQMASLDRVPAYAAVQTTVELARSACGPGAVPFVNAVMRRLAGPEEEEVRPPSSLAERYSHPDWLVARWLERLGPERTEALLRHNNTRPPLVLQAMRGTDDDLLGRLRAAGVDCNPTAAGYGVEVRAPSVTGLPGYDEGEFIVQDPAQRILLAFADIPPGATVWDVCAAPGGKASFLSRTHRVLASDASRSRLRRLRTTVARTRTGIPLFVARGQGPPVRRGTLACVLVDAPCSATGTIARHPDARWRLSPARIRAAATRQEDILAGVADTVQTGGLLVYLTCSLEPEENALQIDRFLDAHRGFEREGPDCHLLPPESGADGGYGARLRRIA